MDIEIVYVGSAGHLKRYKVVDENGQYVPGGLFSTAIEAHTFIAENDRPDPAVRSDITTYGAGGA